MIIWVFLKFPLIYIVDCIVRFSHVKIYLNFWNGTKLIVVELFLCVLGFNFSEFYFIEVLVEFCTETIQPCVFAVVGRLLMTPFIFLQFIGLFKLFTWSWFNYGMWYLYRKLFVSSTVSSFMDDNSLKYDLITFWILSVCCCVTLFISNFINLDILCLPFD